MSKFNDICFVICPIGFEGSEIRKKSDLVFNNIIAPSMESLNYKYKPIRSDHLNETGIITSQIIQYIANSPLLIADLTDKNPNVFYELAIRHMLKKSCILIIEKGHVIPFDIASSRTIQYDLTLEGGSKAIEKLKSTISAISLNEYATDNPISIAFDLANLHQSGKTMDIRIAELSDSYNELKFYTNQINKKLSLISEPIAKEYLQEKVAEFETYILNDLKQFVVQSLVKLRKKGLSEAEISYLQERILDLESKINSFSIR